MPCEKPIKSIRRVSCMKNLPNYPTASKDKNDQINA